MLTEPHKAVTLAEDQLRSHARDILPNAKIWLFGSRATNEALRCSDFDLAVQLDGKTPETVLMDFEESIRSDPNIIYPVDVINLNKAPSHLRQEVLRNGILWTN